MAADRSVMSNEENTKERAARIKRDYYHRPDAFLRWRRRLAVAALAIGIAWCAWGALDQGRHYSPGLVASPHAMWENDCDACHAPFTPMRGDTWLSSKATQEIVDNKCQACHPGPIHHPHQKAEDVVGCANCHTDHHGRDASLTRVADRQCTTCHENLNAHRVAGESAPTKLPESVANITRFDLKHPEFQLLETDVGKLKFSHRRHMAPGLNMGNDDRFPALKWGSLPASYKKRFLSNDTADDALVQLTCVACHQFNSADPVSTGAHSLPIVYENDCAACHPLNYDPEDTDSRETMPHGLSAEQMRDFLKGAYAQAFLRQDQKLLELRVPAAPLPAPEDLEQLDTIADQVREKVRRTATFVRGRCGECHTLEARTLAVHDGGKQSEEVWFGVAPTNVPQVWFKKARFDHGAHQAVSCQACHAQAYNSATLPPGDPASWADHELVMLPGRETCLRCHAPQTASGGGARFDCAECHVYHGLGDPRKAGNLPPNDTAKRSIEELLRAGME